MATTIIHSATLVNDRTVTRDAWVIFRDGRVHATGRGDEWRVANAEEAVEIIDGTGSYLTPGFIDQHGHGGGGHSYDEADPSALQTAMDTHLAHGTTRQVLSLVANPVEVLAEQMGRIRAAMTVNPRILGVHLEGPFLSLAHKGAHEAKFLADPTPERVAALLEAGDGIIRQITIAPELPGAMPAIETFARAGIAVAVGHCAADYATATEAFRRGASILTHAFNAMEPILHRAPGPIIAALDAASVTIEAICDGVHVNPRVLRLLFDSAPERIALVTDAMAAAGAADGDYMLGTLPVYVVGGVARLDTGQIAGSTLTLDRAIDVAVHQVGIPIEQAVAAATLHPARALGIDGLYGTLTPGKIADAVLLDKRFHVLDVWVAGEKAARI